MYIAKNAWANLRRNAARNTIMTVIMFALITSAAISIIINTSAEQMISHYKQQFDTEVVITRDDDKLPQDFTQFIVPDKELLDKLAASQLLKEATKTMSTAVILDGVKTINEGNRGGGILVDNSGAASKKVTNYISPNAMVFATTNPQISDEFKQGIRKIVEGTMYKEKDEAIISKKLADANKLKIGDLLTLKTVSLDASQDPSATMNIKIAGIYEDHTEETDPDILMALTTRANEVFIDYSSVEASSVFTSQTAQYDVRFTLHHPEDLAALDQEFHSLGLPEYYRVSTDDTLFKKIVGPVEGMADITRSFTIGILLSGAIVLTILSVLTIRERTYEVGVLRAIGMKKGQVITGFIIESLLMMGIALVVAMGTAAMVNKPIANSILDVQKTSVHEENTEYVESGLQITNSDISEIEEVSTSFSTDAMVKIIVISFILALIASASSVIYITRYEPMKILSERN